MEKARSIVVDVSDLSIEGLNLQNKQVSVVYQTDQLDLQHQTLPDNLK